MPEVKVSHQGLAGEDATAAPKREPVPPGVYKAVIMGCPIGTTNHQPPLTKISTEFQLIHKVEEDGSLDTQMAGRRVWQDFILEPDERKPDMSKLWRYELRMLLDATGTPFTEAGFNTDHVVNKAVIITVRHRSGKVDPNTGIVPVYSNVVKVDTAEEIADEEFV
jgi:hypothetical protein